MILAGMCIHPAPSQIARLRMRSGERGERSNPCMATRRHAVGLLVLCAVLWSTGGLLIKWLPGSAFAIAGVRSALAAVVLLLAIREWPSRCSWWLGSGALAGAASMLGFVIATKLTTA